MWGFFWYIFTNKPVQRYVHTHQTQAMSLGHIPTCGTWTQPAASCSTVSCPLRLRPSRCPRNRPVSAAIQKRGHFYVFVSVFRVCPFRWGGAVTCSDFLLDPPLAPSQFPTTSCPFLWLQFLRSCDQILVFDPCKENEGREKN